MTYFFSEWKETMQQLQNVIESAFERRADITPANVDTVTREAITSYRPS